LLGYCPGNGKLNKETYKLCSGTEMTVGLVTDNFKATRTFTREKKNKKDGSIKFSHGEEINVYPSEGESKKSQKEDRIANELGDFPVMLDFNEFLNKSDNKRRDFIYSLSPKSESDWTREDVEQYLRDELLTVDLEVNNLDQYEIMEEIIENCMKQFPEGFDIEAGLQAMIDWAYNKRSHWREEKENAQGAVRKISDLKNKLEETDRNLRANKKERDEAQKDLVKVEKQITQAEEKEKAAKKRKEKIEKLEAKLEKLKEKEVKTDTSETDRLIKQYQEQIKEVDFSDQKEELNKKLEDLKEKKDNLLSSREKLSNQITKLKTGIQHFNETLKTIKSNDGLCVVDDAIKCNKDFSKYIEYAELQKKENSEKLHQLKEKMAELNNEIARVKEDIQATVKKHRELGNKADKQARENEKARKRINELQKEKQQIANAEENHQEKVKMHEEQLQELREEKIEPAAPLEPLKKQKKGLESKIEKLKEKIEKQEEAKNTLSNLKSSMIDSKKAQYYYTNFRSLYDALGAGGLQGELVKERLEPIETEIQSNLKAMGIDNEFYFQTQTESGKEVFQFGWKNRFGDRLNFDALSTGQQIILLIAMMTTIIDQADPACKILSVDKIENLDYKNFQRVIRASNKISDKLDNILFLLRTPWKMELPDEIEGFKVWELKGEKADETAA
ncbi:MAG: hypothetical protein ACOCTM_03025, partial [Bacteroidota bacterium]